MISTQLNTQSQKGFTLIELVIVVVILGLLAATAIPRFLNVTEDAEDATVEGVAGGFATGVGLVRAQWELESRPRFNQATNISVVTIDGLLVGIDGDTGYPTGDFINDANSEDDSITPADCRSMFGSIMQSSPRITTDWSLIGSGDFQYYTDALDGVGIGGNDVCLFHLIQTVKNDPNAPTTTAVGNGFAYDPRIGQVQTFSNN